MERTATGGATPGDSRARPWAAWETRAWEALYTLEARLAVKIERWLRSKRALPRNGHIGILPAVYFPHLRLGSVMFQAWHEGTADTELAFRGWKPRKYPPPFGCYVPRLTLRENESEESIRLIAHVARVTDALAGDATIRLDPEQLAVLPASQLRAGISSWRSDHESLFVLDADFLVKDAGVQATSVVYVLPEQGIATTDGVDEAAPHVPVIDHVPLLYFQSNAHYADERLTTYLLTLLEAVDGDVARDHAPDRATLGPQKRLRRNRTRGLSEEDYRTGRLLMRTLRAVAELARLRARTWIHPTTRLLTRAGFAEIRRDVQYRTFQGHSFSQLFFDIDHFKELNDRLGYDGADTVARAIAAQVQRYAHRWLDEEYDRWRKLYHPFTLDATMAETIWRPDAFRAFIAHVSGDEFKLYVRTDDPILVREGSRDGDDHAGKEAAALNDFAEGLLGAVRLLSDKRERPTAAALLHDAAHRTPRHTAINAERILTKLIEEDLEIRARALTRAEYAAQHPTLVPRAATATDPFTASVAQELNLTTVSLGIARLWTRTADPGAVRRVPGSAHARFIDRVRTLFAKRAVDGDVRLEVRLMLENSDALKPDFERLNVEAERALDAAKKRGRNRKAFFHETLRDGGSVLDPAGAQVRLSLGEVDFVRDGDEFDIFAPSSRTNRAAETAARAERRAYRDTAPWVARVRVHKVWPREAMAHVLDGNPAEIERGQWLRFDTSRGARAVRFTIVVPRVRAQEAPSGQQPS